MPTELDLTDAELESRLRDACRAVIPHLLDDQGTATPWSMPPRRSWTRPLSIAAAAALVVGAAAVFSAVRTGNNTPATQRETATISCDDSGCHGWNQLAVVPGATDFYVGPESLGEPKVNLNLFESFTRCAELDPSFTKCAKVEGIAGIGLVDYPVDRAVTVDTVHRSELSYAIHVDTTFTDIDALQFARDWRYLGAGQSVITDVTVRGQRGQSYLNNYGLPAVTWPERPGVLVTVSVPPEQESELIAIAEGVRVRVGPTTIPDRVVVGGGRWLAGSNDATGSIVGRLGDLECFGYQYVDSCGQTIDGRTKVINSSSAAIFGSTPAEVLAVQVTMADGSTQKIDTTTFAHYHSRFYQAAFTGGQIARVEWLDNSEMAIAALDIAPPPPGSATVATAPETVIDGVVIIDASGDPTRSAELATYLQNSGVAVLATVTANEIVSESMLQPIDSTSGSAERVNAFLGIGGYDTYTDGWLGTTLPEGTKVVITLGTDGGPPLFVTAEARLPA